jgi:hypothetical protein
LDELLAGWKELEEGFIWRIIELAKILNVILFFIKMNIAVILAGGIGSRMESSLPKQFLEIEGKQL